MWSVTRPHSQIHSKTYKVAILQQHELSSTHILVGVLEVRRDAFAIHGALSIDQLEVPQIAAWRPTSGEHLAVASANFSMGLVRPGIVYVYDPNQGSDGGNEVNLVAMK